MQELRCFLFFYVCLLEESQKTHVGIEFKEQFTISKTKYYAKNKIAKTSRANIRNE